MISESPLFDALREGNKFRIEEVVSQGVTIREIDTGRCFTLSLKVLQLSQSDLCEIAGQVGLNLGLQQVK